MTAFLNTAINPMKSDGRVINLTDESFESQAAIIDSPIFVLFTEKGCPLCKFSEELWATLAYGSKGDDTRLGKVDCSMEKSTCKKFQVEHLPAFLLFSNENVVEFPTRTAEGKSNIDGKEKMLTRLLEFIKGGWMTSEKKSRLVYSDGTINWKLIILAVFVMLVLFCGCIGFLIWIIPEESLSVPDDSTSTISTNSSTSLGGNSNATASASLGIFNKTVKKD